MSLISQMGLLFLAGGVGTLSRYALSSLASRWLTSPEPWGTAIINILGCFCFGAIAAAFQMRGAWSLSSRVIILTGFFGAFTTFSTYMFEFHALLSGGAIGKACVGFLLQNGLGFAALALGIFLVRRLAGG